MERSQAAGLAMVLLGVGTFIFNRWIAAGASDFHARFQKALQKIGWNYVPPYQRLMRALTSEPIMRIMYRAFSLGMIVFGGLLILGVLELKR
jgi:membrane protein required for beta-lactamase induction